MYHTSQAVGNVFPAACFLDGFCSPYRGFRRAAENGADQKRKKERDMVTNVYERYYKARAVFSGVERRGALVMLTSDSEGGFITYKAAVTFFPHADEEDFAVSCDAYFEKELYSGKGRRSKKKEASFLEKLTPTVDEIAAVQGAAVLWDEPLTEDRRG